MKESQSTLEEEREALMTTLGLLQNYDLPLEQISLVLKVSSGLLGLMQNSIEAARS